MNENDRKDNNDDKKRRGFLSVALLVMVGIFLLAFLSRNLFVTDDGELTYNEFLQKIEQTDVEKIKVVEIDESHNKITIVIREGGLGGTEYTTGMVGDVEQLREMLLSKGIPVEGKVITETSPLLSLLIYLIPSAAVIIFFTIMMRKSTGGGGGIFGVGKNNAKVYMQKETGVTFDDVAGQDEAEDSLVEIVDFLHNPGKYTQIGAKLPKGALLVGPPGTGKTLLAKAVAGEAKVPFFSLAGSDFVEMFVGVGASRVRDLFKNAQEKAPCIIFIDEIDAIGKSRDTRFGGNDEREQTLNALLAEMDGFDSSKGVFILAATNRPEVLDPALCRPGRLDRRIIVDKPDLKGRLAVLKVHSKEVRMDETVDLDEIAMATAGAVGSDLANMINEAAILAAKNGRKAVSQADLFESVEVVIAGKEKKDRVMNDKEKKMVAYHEVGHALAAALQKNTEPIQKITIVPRTMGTLGYVMQTPEEEKFLMTKAEMEEELITLLAGRATEELYFDSVSTGASNDIEKATKLARNMITRYGMSEEFGLMSLENVESMYLTGHTTLNCADKTAAEVDDAVKAKLKEAYVKSKEIIGANREAMDRIAAYLLQKETITGKEFMTILKEVKGEPEDAAPETETQDAGNI
ncbi:MAG: ATP-dependent zinc metalloprotease FtsH [Lachnospiraceae bacterium]|nr:ATP-dependent zinc metalloprotease FtsH [Lachnospiraceae bacterium]